MEAQLIADCETVASGEASANWASKRRMRDYATVGQKLFFQRIIIYSSAIILAGVYYDPYIAVVFYLGVWLCELYDYFTFRLILKRRTWNPKSVRYAMAWIYGGTLLSSVTISLFCISVAMQQTIGTGHFFPLFLLVSASIFAAMNNHHFLPVLALRLTLYASTVLFIPIRDVWIISPPLTSEIWLNLFTVLFVLAFILELSRSFLIGYSRYLSSRKELEDEHKRTKLAYEAKTRFIATVSHELRTPLTSILGSLELIQSGAVGKLPDKFQRLVDIASRNSSRLHELVGDLLFIQSSEVGKIQFDFESLELGNLVDGTLERFQPYAQKLDVEVESDYGGKEFWVVGDRKRIDQVLSNLLSNAAKFSDKNGKITVSLEMREDRIRLSVRDEGIGIADGKEGDVFAEFTQLDSNDDRKFGGTGLGLSISKRIVEAHHGTIGYSSQLGVGTTFYVELKQLTTPETYATSDAVEYPHSMIPLEHGKSRHLVTRRNTQPESK